ncbi:MAG: DNA-packaging protein [Proteobacteria bacterium]|nr:DNA-packaging protein [Pseudomonadota bacterium]
MNLLRKFLKLLCAEKKRRKKLSAQYNWHRLARHNQLPPKGNWRIWLILAGRGFGKTRTGSETLRQWVREGSAKRIALVGETEIEVRQVMVEGPSGLLAVHPPAERPLYEPSKRQIMWPCGALATCFSAQAYEQLRGPQFDTAWVDELAKFQDAEKVWNQLMFTLRRGINPRAIVTTTPRSTQFIKKLSQDPDIVVTKGSTFENAKNLARPFLDYMFKHYEKSSLGRQELYADFIDDHQGALWNSKLIEQARSSFQNIPLQRIVISIDPAVSCGAQSDETGIIAAGITTQGVGVVLEDFSIKAPASAWIKRAIDAYHRLNADRIVAEVNMGGDLVEQLLRSYDTSISFKAVRATRSKIIRAEPIAALYERGKIWHAQHFPELEAQLCTYIPGVSPKSPDRLDALVWALSDLLLVPSCGHRVWLA